MTSTPSTQKGSAGLGDRAASAEFVEKIPIGFARRHLVLGLASDGSHLQVAMTAPPNLEILQVVGRFLHRPARAVIAAEEEIRSAINLAYQQRTGQAQAVIQKMERADVLQEVEHLADREDLLDADSTGMIRGRS